MSTAGRAPSRFLAAAGLTGAALAGARVASDLGGAAPLTLALGLLPVPLAMALAGALPAPRIRRARPLLALLPALALLLAPPAASMLGRLLGDVDVWALACILLGAVAALPLAWRGREVLEATRPGPLTDAAGVVAGSALAIVLPPWGAALTAGLALELARRAARPAAPALPAPVRGHRIAGLALVGVAALYGLAWLRGIVSPGPGDPLVAVAAAVTTAAVLRGLSPRGPSWSPVFGAAALLLVVVAAWKTPGLARMAVLAGVAESGPLPAGWLRAVPMAALGLLVGAAAGLAWGARQQSSPTWLWAPAAAGLVLLVDRMPPLWLAAGVGLSAMFWTIARGPRLLGAAVGLGCLAVAWLGGGPDAAVLAQAAWPLNRHVDAARIDLESRTSTTTILSEVDVRAAATELRVPTDRWDAARSTFQSGATPVLLAASDGVMAESAGRGAEAERFVGELAPLVAARTDRVLLLGDDLGQVARALTGAGAGSAADSPGRISTLLIATPQPELVRAIAAVARDRAAAWLDPRVQLQPLHPDIALRVGPPVDVVVEVQRAPWSDGVHAGPSPAHLDAVRARLAPGGSYLLALHLGWFDPGQPAAVAAAIADRFPHVQAWLPPYGADTLILHASDAPVPFSRLAARLDGQPGLLSRLDLSTPEDLASLAVTDAQGLRAWAEAGDAPPLTGAVRPGTAATARPVLHLAPLAAHLADPTGIWVIDDEEVRTALAGRASARESFLRLLGEATTGNLEAVFRRARELQSAGGSVGAATLEPLIDPHLRDGRRAMARAQAEGLSSRHWDDALRYATTARMLAPTSPRPLVLLGEISLGRASVSAAEQHFEQALELDATHLAAQTGLARAARARGDRSTAEAAFREAVRLAPRDWRTAQNLGVFLMQEGRRAEAEPELRRSIELAGRAEPGPYLGLAELMLEDGRPSAALLTAEESLAAKDTGYGWYLRGRAHYDLGQLERAEQDFRRAVILEPDLAEARGGIGLVLARRGELQQAAEAFRAVLRTRPDHAAARENLRRIEEEIAATEPVAP